MAWLENDYYIKKRLSYTVSRNAHSIPYQETSIRYRIKKRFLRALEEKQPQEKEQQADA